MTDENKKSELLQQVEKADSVCKMVEMCIFAYKIIEEEKDPEDFLCHFALKTQEKWFLENEKKTMSTSDLSGLLSLLDDHKNPESVYDDRSKKQTTISNEEINYHLPKCKSLSKGVIDYLSNKGYEPKCYYKKLWDTISNLLCSASEVEKGVCLYAILRDQRTPYYQIEKGLYMENDQYRKTIDQIDSQLNKLRFVLNLANSQRTETASQILEILDELETKESKAVFLSQLILSVKKKYSKSSDPLQSLLD